MRGFSSLQLACLDPHCVDGQDQYKDEAGGKEQKCWHDRYIALTMQPLQTSLGGVAIHSSFSEFGAPSAPSTWKDAAAALNRTKGAGLPSPD
jgi:hypothetical protein